MSQLKVNSISDAAGANGNAITLATDGTCTAKVTNNLSNRNLIINGACNVAQRSQSSTSAGYKTVDRYKAEGSNTGQTATQSQQSLSSSDTGPWEKGFRKYYRLALAATGTANVNAWASMQQRVEAQNIACSGWDYTSASSNITLSFWFRASTNQTFYSYIYAYDGTPKAYTFSFTATGNNTWTKVTKTIPGNSGITVDNDNGAGLQISLIAFAGTNYTNNRTLNTWAAHDGNNYAPDMATTWITTGTPTFDLTGVQLEVGDVATDFEHRSYGDELLRCCRYFYKADGYNSHAMYSRSSTAVGATVNTPVPMRASPTAGAGHWCRVMKATATDDYGDSSTGSFTVGGSAPSVTQTGSAVFLQYGSMSNVTNTANTGYGYLTNPIEFEAEL